MRTRTHIAIAAFAAPLFLAAVALEASAQDAPAAASPETETSAAMDCPEQDAPVAEFPPQEELARDIRAIAPYDISPAQLEALAQAARIAPEQISDSLYAALVDAVQSVNIFYFRPPDAREDSLSHLLFCALQPHFSQKELTANILSINSFDELGFRQRTSQGQQEVAAFLAMHIRPEEMGKELKNAVIEGMLSIGRKSYGMFRIEELLSKALLKHYAKHSDADFAAEIRSAGAEGKGPDALLVANHVAVRWDAKSGDIRTPENIGPESRSALIDVLRELNARVNERAWLQEQRVVAGDEEIEKDLEKEHIWENKSYRAHSMLTDGVFGFAEHTPTSEIIETLAGSTAGGFSKNLDVFGNRGVVPIINVLSGKHVHTLLASTGLNNLVNIVSASMQADRESLSPENRALLVNTARRFLDKEGLKDFRGLTGARQVLDGAIGLALYLDDPDLVQIVETLALSRDEAIVRGIPAAEAEYVREDVQRRKKAQAESEARNEYRETEKFAMPNCPEQDPSAAELPPQEELARDIRTIVTGEKSSAQREALLQATRIAPGQISDALREVLIDAAAFEANVVPLDSTDVLSRLLLCALQPRFSQEEMAAAILSINSVDEQGHYLPEDRSHQTAAAWLAAHIPPGEMGEALQRAVVRGMLGIGSDSYPMHTVWYLLSKALSKQYAGYSDADLAAEIRAFQEGKKDVYASIAATHGVGRLGHPGFGRFHVGAPESVGPKARLAITETPDLVERKNRGRQ